MTKAERERFEAMGKAAFDRGVMCAPAMDLELAPEIKLMSTGKPVGATIGLLDAWIRGWTRANLDAPWGDAQ